MAASVHSSRPTVIGCYSRWLGGSAGGGAESCAADERFTSGGSWGLIHDRLRVKVGSAGLMRAGTPAAQALTTPTGELHSRPYFLPDGQALVYTSQRQGAPAQIALLDLDSGESHVLLQGDEARVTAQGFLVFRRTAALWAAPFDLRRRALTGEPVPLVDLVRGGAHHVADNGTLVHAPPRE
jgi:hypothetical protein